MDIVDRVIDLNRQSFPAGDEYNSAALLRGGVESGQLIVLTVPRRPIKNTILSAYIVLKLDRRVIRVERVAVAPHDRNAGIGREIIERAIKWRDRNRPGVPLWAYISADNTASINAHVHAGFGIEVNGPDWVWVMG